MGLQHLTALVLCVWGCADAARTVVESGRDAGSLRPGIDLSGIVEHYASSERLEGVKVCQDGVPNCAMTDAYGWFALGGIVPETEILLVYRKDGFMPSLQPVVAPRWSSEFPVFGLYPRDDLLASWEKQNAVLGDAGRPEVDLPDEALASRAQILFGASSGILFDASSRCASSACSPRMGLDQVHVELDPRSGDGPFFTLGNGDIVLDAPTGGPSVIGSYTNVEPRDDGYELVYQYAHGECRQGSNAWGGWPSAKGSPNATRVPARAGYITALTGQECKSADAGTASDAGQD
jgi:hypothetical protein